MAFMIFGFGFALLPLLLRLALTPLKSLMAIFLVASASFSIGSTTA